ncbi:MAG TPA: twin-arginine translocase TatA/TatE family subunit [Actinomycetota bacterium]|nr:twin-arginine translocase TatA/TatE family subunit [Actinomycetota bacterium]
MPQIGPLEIMAVAVLALVVFGPQRLPEIARNIGKAINEVRRMTSEMKSELREGMSMDDADDDEPPEPAKPIAANPDEQER